MTHTLRHTIFRFPHLTVPSILRTWLGILSVLRIYRSWHSFLASIVAQESLTYLRFYARSTIMLYEFTLVALDLCTHFYAIT